MMPPGRRRLCRDGSVLCLLTSLLISVLVVSLPPAASAAGSGVIGIDMGTEYLKAALVKPGIPLEIVLTKDAKRKEPAAVAFKPTREKNAVFPERFYGGDALGLAPRFPEDVYSNLKVLLGVPLEKGVQGMDTGHEEPVVPMYKERYPALKIAEAPGGRGTVGIKSELLGEQEGREAFLVEELLAMQLKQVKADAETMAGWGSTITDAVITFPAFYTEAEKRSVQLAADLAGLNLVSMISDGLAVGTNYATSRTFPSVSDGQTPEYHVVFDMGAGSTTATVLRFQSRTVKDVGKFNKTVQEVQVLGTGWDQTLGGDALNHLIVNDMVEKLVESKKLSGKPTSQQIKSHGRTMAKLWRESERLRQILSANSDATASFETVYAEDVNFKYTLSRSNFEKLAKSHAERVANPLQEALTAAKLSLNDMESVILHGGAIRTPFVQKQLEAACKGSSNVRTNVNADEAAVFGAAFKGAAFSPSFRVKDIRTSDAAGYAAGVKWSSPSKERHQKLFTPQSEVGPEKHLTLKKLEDFEFDFYHQSTRDGELVESPILKVQTTNLTQSVSKLKGDFKCAPSNITTQFSVRLSPFDGLPEVVSGTVSCEVYSEEKKGVVEDVKDLLGLGSKKPDQQPLNDQDPAPESVDLDGSASSSSQSSSSETSTSTSTSSSTSASESTSASASQKSENPKEMKVTVESIQVGFTSSRVGISSLSAEEMRRIKERLSAFDASDVARVQRAEIFNTLESSIYRTRDLVTDEQFLKTIAEDTLAKLKERLSDADIWLYGDGVDASTEAIKAKYTGLKELVDPVLARQKEHSLRPGKVESLKQSLTNAKMLLDVVENSKKAEESQSSESEHKSETATTSTATSSPTASPSSQSASDDFASLENDQSSSSTSSETTSSPSATPSSISSLYNAEDVSAFSSTFDKVNTWLETQLEQQGKLTESEDPVLTVADIESNAREIEQSLNRMISRARKPDNAKGNAKKGNNAKKTDKGKNEKEPENKDKDTDKESDKPSEKEKEKQQQEQKDKETQNEKKEQEKETPKEGRKDEL